MDSALKKYEYFRTDNGVLYCVDCLEILPMLGKVDLVLTDPPYGMNYKCDVSSMAKRGSKYGGRNWAEKFDDTNEFNPKPFLNFEEVIFFGYNHFADKLPKGTVFVWIKVFDSGYGKFFSDAELAWMNRGNGVYCHRDTTMKGVTVCRKHPCQKPVGLFMWLLKKSKTAGTVLDPYLGSGTTAIACERLGRRWIGIEISEKYCEIAKQRIIKETQQLKMF